MITLLKQLLLAVHVLALIIVLPAHAAAGTSIDTSPETATGTATTLAERITKLKTPPTETDGWKKVKDADGITVYNKNTRTSSRVRAVGRIKVNDIYSIIAIADDYENMHKWLALPVKITEINRDDYFNRYLHGIANYPILKSREFVSKIAIVQNPSTRAITAEITNKYNYTPLNPKYKRYENMESILHFDVISSTEIEATVEISIDFLMVIPKSMINLFSKHAPYASIKNFREMAQDPKYHNLETLQSEIQFK